VVFFPEGQVVNLMSWDIRGLIVLPITPFGIFKLFLGKVKISNVPEVDKVNSFAGVHRQINSTQWNICFRMLFGAVIGWYFDIQLPVKSVTITTNVVSSNLAQARCTQYIIWYSLSVTCVRSVVFSGYCGFIQQ
jgi:hypothetical protein